MSESWFAVDRLAPGVWRLAEPGHVCSWLVEGNERAALIDTGLGFLPMRPVVESLTSRPVLVVNTHNHMDHVGSNHEWDEIAIHALGADGLEDQLPSEKLQAWVDYARLQVENFHAYSDLDRRFFHLLEKQHTVRPLPPHIDRGEWTIPISRATRILNDGDRVELGGRELVVWHTPGHSPDSISLELADERMLFAGDTVNTGPVYAQLRESNLEDFASSINRLAAASSRFERVFCAHFLRTEVHKWFIAAQQEAFEAVLAREVAFQPVLDDFGASASEAVFDGFSILVPTAAAEPLSASVPPERGQ